MMPSKPINVLFSLAAAVAAAMAGGVHAAAGAGAVDTAAAAGPVCLAPAKPGGGMDQTCKLIQQALGEHEVHISYLPGGIGAVAWNSIITRRRAEKNTLVAYSGGSLLNLAEGKFGKSGAGDVRWVAGIGTDYGMIAVRSDSPYKNLRELMQAIKDKPSNVTIGAGGTVGSQDWLKMSLIARRADLDPKSMRIVALEGGGESFTALLAGYVQAISGDASEASLHIQDGKIRVLAVLSDARLPGLLANVPTAREQGYDVSWPIIRGVYVGPQVSDDDYRRWVARFDQAMARPDFAQMRAAHGLYPFAMTGKDLTAYINKTVQQYRIQAKEFGLLR